MERLKCNQLLDVAENLVDEQGVVSFRFAQIAKISNCSTNTLYRYFSSKEDVLVCLFLRSTTSCHIPLFWEQNPDLTIYHKALVPVLFTYGAVQNNPIFNILRVVSINSMFWQMASDEKKEVLKQRVDLFWSHIHNPLVEARDLGALKATDTELLEMTQSIYFFLAGAISSYQSGLMDSKYLPGSLENSHRHLSQIFNRLHWDKPITLEMIKELDYRVKAFIDHGYQRHRSCENCMSTSETFCNNSRAVSR